MNNSFDEIQSDAVDFEAREAHEAQQELDFDPARDTDMIHDIRQDTKWLMGGIVWRYYYPRGRGCYAAPPYGGSKYPENFPK
jgi:hypothetical protein